MRIIFATNNKHKLSEIVSIFGDDYKDKVFSLNDFDIHIDPEEKGKTFEENANIKSKAAYEVLREKNVLKVGDFIISDDTGLCIDYFDGAPGIYSARFMGDISQTEKNKKIIEEMKDLDFGKRNAYFITNLSVIEIRLDKDLIDMPAAKTFVGKVDGFIAKNLEGSDGFGYDPIFAVKEYSDLSKNIVKTYSSLGQKCKNSISHRAKAIEAFVDYLEKNHNI